MRPFFAYYGAKHQLARYYGKPRREVVVEPFAGSAAYCTYWDVEYAILIEKDPTIYGVWQWLIEEATYDSIMALDHTLTTTIGCTYDQRIKDLIGLWFYKGNYRPTESMSVKIAKINAEKGHLWSYKNKVMLAEQVHKIKKWQVAIGDYSCAPKGDFHYFVDPPYQKGGWRYKYGNKGFDFDALAEWCMTLPCGDVCEQEPADWLPFEVFRSARHQKGQNYNELIYRLDDPVNRRLFDHG